MASLTLWRRILAPTKYFPSYAYEYSPTPDSSGWSWHVFRDTAALHNMQRRVRSRRVCYIAFCVINNPKEHYIIVTRICFVCRYADKSFPASNILSASRTSGSTGDLSIVNLQRLFFISCFVRCLTSSLFCRVTRAYRLLINEAAWRPA